MSLSQIKQITQLVESAVLPLGLTLVDVHFGQAGKNRTLAITIFSHKESVSFDICELASKAIEAELDKQNPPLINGAYLLEVQSPGIDRTLKTERDFQVFAGHTVEIKTKESIDILGYDFAGKLLGKSGNCLVISEPMPMPKPAKKQAKSSTNILAKKYPAQLTIDMDKLIAVKLYPYASITELTKT